MSLFSFSACRACTRRLTRGTAQQIRHKSKTVKATTISVRLLQDVPKLGRKGSIVPVARGTMRMMLYPYKYAEYMTHTALKRLPPAELEQQPDVTFRPDLPEEKPKIEVTLQFPEATKSMNVLNGFLPPKIMFSRATISPTENTIHGSISTNDICTAVRAICSAKGDEGSRVVVTPDMISFLDPAVEGDRVKTTGEHEFEIRMKGAAKPVKRAISIARQISFE